MIELYPYQKVGVKFLRSMNYVLLGDDMGLGKSAQLIRASVELKRILIVCPATAKINWQREFWKFARRKAFIHGNGGQTRKGDHIVIASYEHVTKFLDFYLGDRRWDLIGVDECHMLKEPTSKRSVAVLGKEGLLHRTNRMWLLSGTPSPNHAGELWLMLYTFGYTKLSYDGFTARYCNSHRTSGHYSRIQITGSNTKHTPELKTMLKKFCLRRLKKDVLPDLPPLFHYVHYIQEEGGDPFKDFPELRSKVLAELESLKERLDFDIATPNDEKLLSTLSLMSQSVSSLRRYHGLKKVKPVAALVKQELELGLYDKIVIFGIHKDVLESLQESLTEHHALLVNGSTPPKVKQMCIDTFQNESFAKVFIANIQAAGTAINLTAASQVLFIEQDWVPGNNAQAAMRCHRIGQDRAVTVRHAALANSFDDRVTAILTRKIQELATFI